MVSQESAQAVMGLEGVTKKSQAAVKTSAMRTSAFPFLQLPAEIRNHIYELVFTQDIHFHHRSDKGKEPPSRNNMLSVLLLNRQMYAETRLLPFNFSTFVFNKALTASVVPSIYFTRDCMDLLDGLPDWQRSEIRHLEFPVAKGELKDFLHTDIHSACWEKAWRALGYALDNLEARFALLDQYRKAWEQDISVVDLE